MEAHDVGTALQGVRELRLSAATTAREADEAFRKLAAFNGGGVFVGRFSGRSPWERHPTGDELLHVLDGAVEVTLLAGDGPTRVTVAAGSVFVVPRGVWHRQLPRPVVTLLNATPQPTDVSFAEDPSTDATRVDLDGLNHVGIRVRELARSVEFYGRLGFAQLWYYEPHRVAGLRNGTGIELNLIVNADDDAGGRNILMDVPQKYPGYTHASFRVASIDATVRGLEAAGIAISEGPLPLGGEIAVFVRDPDGNVVELAEILPGPA
jgi:lactoylglutathione lyase